MKPMFKTLAALAAVAAGFATPAFARPVVDCPLRDAPFSASSPLIDIMLSRAAKTIVETELNAKFDTAPERFVGTKPPTFAAILTLREGGRFLRGTDASIARADAALRKLPVTPADKVARCARYDNDVPRFTLPASGTRILLFEKINGFKDVPSFDAAHAALTAMAQRKGWTIVATDKGGAFTPAMLRQFDMVVWNNISGDVLTLSQRRAFRQYIENGGGYFGVHGSAGDPSYFWDWYADGLIGARFLSHPMDPQFQTARVKIDDPAHPIAKGLPAQWDMNDEWYSFKTNPRAVGARVIATLDESTYKPQGMGGMNLRMGDHPIAWTRCIGRGTMFYSAIGHRPERYSDPVYVQMLEQAVEWSASKPCATHK
jgi:type 1 glutamine amidotransferase